jgi:hypothetical protein
MSRKIPVLYFNRTSRKLKSCVLIISRVEEHTLLGRLLLNRRDHEEMEGRQGSNNKPNTPFCIRLPHYIRVLARQ